MRNFKRKGETVFIPTLMVAALATTFSCTQPSTSENTFPKGERINSTNFVGSASAYMIVSTDSVFNTQVASVTFEPGARTNWHLHPSGQILVITDGSGYYQEKGKPKQVLSKGKVVKCPPGITHWHGATPENSMSHLAISPNLQMGSVVWVKKVTEEEYQN
jgi:4-carboxymuconolactone decarboxylase